MMAGLLLAVSSVFVVTSLRKRLVLRRRGSVLQLRNRHSGQVIASGELAAVGLSAAYVVYTYHRTYHLPVLTLRFPLGGSYHIAAMGPAPEWCRAVPEVKKPDFSVDMLEWQRLLDGLGQENPDTRAGRSPCRR